MQERTLARRYARGLFEAARDRKALDRVEADLRRIVPWVCDRAVIRFLNNPCVSFAEKRRILHAALGEDCSPLVLEVMELLAQRRRMKAFPEVARIFGELLDESRQMVRVKLRLAHETPQGVLAAVVARLSSALKRNVQVEPQVDPSLIGGAMLIVGDTVLDGSVKGAIERFGERMKG